MRQDKDGIVVGRQKPLKVCSVCGPKTIMYSGRIEMVICKECSKRTKRNK